MNVAGGCAATLWTVELACSPTLPPSTPGGTFSIETVYQPAAGVAYEVGHINISGSWVSDSPGAEGSAAPVNGTTGSNALAVFLGSRAPATWKFTWNTPVPGQPLPACAGVSLLISIAASQGAGIFGCVQKYEAPFGSAVQMSPSTVNICAPPQTATVSGAPAGTFQSVYGMPQTEYLDSDGNVVGTAQASYVSPNGTYFSGSVPDFSSAGVGTYVGLVGNYSSNGLNIVGGGDVHVIMNRCTSIRNGL